MTISKRVLNKEKLEELLKTGGVSFKETSTSFLLDCPKCNKKEKIAMHKFEGYWCCYRCKDDGFKGKPESLLSILLGKSKEEIRSAIYPNYKKFKEKIFLDLKIIDPWSDEISEPISTDLDFLDTDWNPLFVDQSSSLFEPGRQYLKEKRGLTDEHIQVYNIKYNPNKRAVVFPVMHEGRVYGWQERGIDSDLKHTMKGMPRERTLMFLDRLTGADHCILTEGPVDALKAHRLGGNVAAMGKDVSDRQLELIKARVRRIYIALDPDAAPVINKLCKKLHGEMEVFIMFPPKGRKDFGECSEEEVNEAFLSAMPYAGQKFFYLKK